MLDSPAILSCQYQYQLEYCHLGYQCIGFIVFDAFLSSGKKTKPYFFYFYLKPKEKWLKVDVSNSKKAIYLF